MARQIMFYDGATYKYPEDLVTSAGPQEVKSFLMRVYKGLSGFRYLGYAEIIEIGFDFESYALFARGRLNFFACYQFVKGSYPFTTEMVRYFVLQIALPQLVSLAESRGFLPAFTDS